MTAPAAFVYPIPAAFSDSAAAPLLCAGAIGYRSLRLAGLEDGQILALTGFGASAHLVLALVRHLYPRSPVWVFARSPKERAFALELGAAWAGDTSDQPPALAHAIIDTTPVWKPIVEGLKRLAPGGRLVINAIRKEDSDRDTLLQLDYPAMLWLEKEIKSVANVTRGDVQAFLTLAAEIPIRPQVEEYPLAEANRALRDLKAGHLRGPRCCASPEAGTRRPDPTDFCAVAGDGQRRRPRRPRLAKHFPRSIRALYGAAGEFEAPGTLLAYTRRKPNHGSTTRS